MLRPHGKQRVEEGGRGQHAGLVELLLTQVRLLVHGLHERAHRVERRGRARRAASTQRAYDTATDPLAKTETQQYHLNEKK